MVRIAIDHRLWRQARNYLNSQAEAVGFFLADWSASHRAFEVRAWREIEGATVGPVGDLHVSLSDEVRASVIQWAHAENACLIEAHSHGRWSPAAFSPFDMDGLSEWVPHVWWRLQARPYAALVTTTSDLDGLAWIDAPSRAEQVEGVAEDHFHPATCTTLRRRPKERHE